MSAVNIDTTRGRMCFDDGGPAYLAARLAISPTITTAGP